MDITNDKMPEHINQKINIIDESLERVNKRISDLKEKPTKFNTVRAMLSVLNLQSDVKTLQDTLIGEGDDDDWLE